MTKDMAKAPNTFFTLFFTSKTGLQQSKGLEKVHSKEDSLGRTGSAQAALKQTGRASGP